MDNKSVYNDIENVLRENPQAILIKEGRKENDEYLKNSKNRDKIETIFAKLIYAQRNKLEVIAKKLRIDLVSQSGNLNEFKYKNKIIEPDINLEDFGKHLKQFFKKEDLKSSLKNEEALAKAINSRENFSEEEKSALFNMIKPFLQKNKMSSKNSKVEQIQKPRSELLLKEVLKQSSLDDVDDSVIVIYGKQHIDYVLNQLNSAKS